MSPIILVPSKWRLPLLSGFVALLFLAFGFVALTGGKPSDALEGLAVGGIFATITIVLVHRGTRAPRHGRGSRRRAWHEIAPRPGDDAE